MKNWKTTLMGMLGAGAMIALPWFQSGHVSTRDIVLAFALGALGYMAKDHDVTGGSREQNSPQ